MVQDNVPIFTDHEAVVERISLYHAYIRLKEGPSPGSQHSVFVNAIRVPGEHPITKLTEAILPVGHVVRAFYAQINGLIIMLFLVTEGAKKPTWIEVQDLANDLIGDSSRIQKRLVKTIEAETGESAATPAHLKSAISVPSPIDVRNVLVDQETGPAAGDVAHSEESDASR